MYSLQPRYSPVCYRHRLDENDIEWTEDMLVELMTEQCPWVDISTINLVHNDRLCIVLEDSEPLKKEAEIAHV
jgi:hypothetical protein